VNSETPRSFEQTWADWKGWPYLLIGLTVLLRLAHIWNSSHNPTFWAPAVDPEWYDRAAQNIAQGDWGPFPFFRAPVYPALLAAVYKVFGHDLLAARVLNAALQAVAVWIIYRVGRSYFSPRIGVLAAVLFAVNGMAIYFAAEILPTSTEILAAALLTWATFRLIRDHSNPALIVCGLAWGLAAITRPNFLFLYPVPVVLIWMLARNDAGGILSLKSRYVQRLIPVGIYLAASVVPILPVTAANWIKGGEPVLVATQGGVNFWIGNNPEATGILANLPGYGSTWTMEEANRDAEAHAGRKLNPKEVSSYYYAKGWSFLGAHPFLAIQFMIRKILLFFNRFEISNNKHIEYFSGLSPWLPPLVYLDFGLFVPFGLMGLWIGWKQRPVKILAVLIAMYAVSVALFFITSRFRMPSVPWLCLLAAGGIFGSGEWLRRRPLYLKSFIPFLIFAAGALIAWMNPWDMREAPLGWARYMEGNAYLKLEQLDSARACFLDAIRDSISISESEMNLGVIAGRQGNMQEARRRYKAAIAGDSLNAEAWNNLGTVEESLRDTAAAIGDYRKSMSLAPTASDPRHNLAGTYFRLGVAALKRGSDPTAVAFLLQSNALEQSAITHYDLAIAYGRNGYQDTAVQQLDSALMINPDFAAARELKARLQNGTPEFPESSEAP
jgi:tetratricopeptide (TPR) repeat protein